MAKLKVYGPDIDLSLRGEKLKHQGDHYVVPAEEADEICAAFGLSRFPPPKAPKAEAPKEEPKQEPKAEVEPAPRQEPETEVKAEPKQPLPTFRGRGK